MSTHTGANKFDRRFVATVARAIVGLWPAESREWGQAFAAELPSIDTAPAATSWLIGGVMLLFREWLKHAWRALGRPIGSSADAAETSATFTPRYSRTPRTPLWLMLALTLASALFLLHPETRQALRRLRSAYSHDAWHPDDWSSVKNLRHIAVKNRDPHLIALLAFLTDNDDESFRLSEEAIEKDPSLTWLHYELSLLPRNDLSRQRYLSADRLERLKKWDPQNAVPDLLSAEIISEPVRKESFDAILHGNSKPDWEKQIAQNAAWLSEMHAAFSAPTYDDYTSRIVELIQDVSSRFSLSDPNVAAVVLVRKRLPQYQVWRAYANILIERGAAFEKEKHYADAIAPYSEVLRFAQRLSRYERIPSDKFFAAQLGRMAGEKLVLLYQSTGRPQEASLIASQLAHWNIERQPRMMRYIPAHYFVSPRSSLAWSSLVIQLAGLSMLVVFPVALLSLGFVLRRRKFPIDRRGPADFWASIGADVTPWLLLTSLLLLYITYHPYAQTCASFLNGGRTAPDIETFMTAAIVPDVVPDFVSFIFDPYPQWSAVTTALSILLIYFLYRMLPRRTKSA